jgi:DNA polymerase III epsilon subunit-like protein
MNSSRMGYVKYVCDTETTGTDPKIHDVIEVCFWRIGDDESKTWCIKPTNPDTIEEEALRINKHKREDILHQTPEGKEKYRSLEEVLPEIEIWIMEDGAAAEDRIFIGHNPQFDYDFLLKAWEKAGCQDDFPFGYWIENGTKRNQGFIIDTMAIARLIDMCIDKRRQRYNLGSLVKAFGITRAQAHRADGDVKMTKELFEKMIEPVIDIFTEKFSDCYL